MVASVVMLHRDEIVRVLDRHGARCARIFGSYARGEAERGSDLDVLVVMDDDRSLLDRIGAAQELEDLLGMRVDLVNERALHPLLRERVLAEAVEL